MLGHTLSSHYVQKIVNTANFSVMHGKPNQLKIIAHENGFDTILINCSLAF